jgi:hypothetical protein
MTGVRLLGIVPQNNSYFDDWHRATPQVPNEWIAAIPI